MKTLRHLHLATALMLLALLTACAQMGMRSPETFNQRIAAGYTTVQAVNEGALVALNAGKLSKADAGNIVTSSRAALDGLTVARTLHASDPMAAENRLAATLAILQSLQAYLATQGAK